MISFWMFHEDSGDALPCHPQQGGLVHVAGRRGDLMREGDWQVLAYLHEQQREIEVTTFHLYEPRLLEPFGRFTASIYAPILQRITMLALADEGGVRGTEYVGKLTKESFALEHDLTIRSVRRWRDLLAKRFVVSCQRCGREWESMPSRSTAESQVRAIMATDPSCNPDEKGTTHG